MAPTITQPAFVAENATICGNVAIGKDSSIWFGAVIRAEVGEVVIGEGCNIQDNAVIHTSYNCPVIIGNKVTIAHSSIVHGAIVEDDVLVGMHATVLDGARIGRGSLIAAGALVKENAVIPERSLVVGVPGKILRTLSESEYEHNLANARIYLEGAREYAKSKIL
jgi:carbonic anhydrase/acetyltransferase-like protein (isoleucine patch superfamily)